MVFSNCQKVKSMKYSVSLKKNKDFKRLYYKGKSFASSVVVVYVMKNKSNQNKIGITVSKKLGNAVKRNRVKRRLREAYRLIEESLKPGYNIVIVARSKSAFVKFEILKKSLLELLEKTGCVKNENAFNCDD